jgi:KUP system potassium uptake protein
VATAVPAPDRPAEDVTPAGPRTAIDTRPAGRRLAALSLAALGVVFGDIGTSPLYALRECLHPAHGLRVSEATVYGVLSLIVWSLIIVVSVKYVGLIMRLDNRGEGGILALIALLLGARRQRSQSRRGPLIALGLFGAALLYGDGVITPAISVLSATEGLKVATPGFAPWVLPATIGILLALFAFQRWGTSRVGVVFGPVMLLWFAVIAALGAVEIVHAPSILLAFNPWYGVRLFLDEGWLGFLVLGAVVLAVTGAEALYADMGHFGRLPIRLVWFAVVLPALLLNYFGQGALVLRMPEAAQNPFYMLAPRPLLYPLVALATVATVVASQALISGAFSITHQCIQLRYCPRLSIVHTSRSERGQIYVPAVNWALMIGCLLLVLGFGSSSALGAAYGIAVTGTMVATTVLFHAIARRRWRWSDWQAALVVGGLLVIDLAFLGANLIKIEHGGWVPLIIGGGLFLLMTTWSRGSELFGRLLAEAAVPLDDFIAEVGRRRPPRVPGMAVFLTPNIDGAPLVLQHHLRYNKALHERVVLLSILTREVPEVWPGERIETEELPEGFFRVRAHYGFMERPDVQEVIEHCCRHGLATDADDTTYYLGRARLLPTGPSPMMRWRKRLYSFMARNASAVTDFFNIPPNRVVELGARIEF